MTALSLAFALLGTHGAAAISAPDPALEHFEWHLTFLPGDPPALSDKEKIVDFSKLDLTPSALAQALQDAFATKDNGVSIKAVNRSLVIDAPEMEMGRIQRLLATQIDVPQSQIVLELDAYQASANVKGLGETDLSIRKLMIAQEIARAYKRAHYQAIRDMLMKPDFRVEIQGRRRYGVDVTKLFQAVGLDPDPQRELSQTDVLTFLAYANQEDLLQKYPREVLGMFREVHQALEVRMLAPMRSSPSLSERRLAESLSQLNDLLAHEKGTSPLQASSLLASFASQGSLEDGATRGAVEDFLILWSVTADPVRFNTLRSQPNGSKALGDLLNQSSSSADREGLRVLLSGGPTSKLARVSARLDDLLAIGVEAIQEDSASLVDRPLDAWIDQNVVSKRQESRFGVRFGGRTRIAVTSRAPGVTGAEAESFFPYQPTAPIDLTSLVPLLSRKPQAPAEGVGADLAKGGATSLEQVALQAVFDQANKQPYDRKLTSGIHFSVLPTMLPNGSTARLQIKLSMSVDPDDANKGGARQRDLPGPLDLLKSTVVETELLANAFDITQVSSLKLDVGGPGKRDWEVPILSQILPIRSWFVGPTQDKTVRHEAVVLIKAAIVPRAMDLASRSFNGG